MIANCHVHLPPNFSAFASIRRAVELAHIEGIAILGASNYYDHRIYDSFRSECQTHGIQPLFGIEIVAWHSPSAVRGERINDPGNPGKIYICGKALRRWSDPPKIARELLEIIRHSDRQRMAQMAERLAECLLDADLAITLSVEAVVDRVARQAQVDPDQVTLQERHLAEGAQLAIFEAFAPEARASALERLLGAAVDPSSAPQVQTAIRSALMKAGKPAYVHEAFISLDEARTLIESLEGIVAYPVVADGMNPRSEFEADASTMIQNLRKLEIDRVEFIPNRNDAETLPETVGALIAAGFKVTAGTEHNTSEMLPLRPSCRDGEPLPAEVDEHFRRGALDLVEWQDGPRARRQSEARFAP